MEALLNHSMCTFSCKETQSLLGEIVTSNCSSFTLVSYKSYFSISLVLYIALH